MDSPSDRGLLRRLLSGWSYVMIALAARRV
jgi:hypothetical protein